MLRKYPIGFANYSNCINNYQQTMLLTTDAGHGLAVVTAKSVLLST